MAGLTISQVAGQVDLRPSAIRYYEKIGILPAAQRSSGQRRYDETIMYRLAVIQRARLIGFSLEEIRRLFFGFRTDTPASKRWRELSQQKLAELETLVEHIQTIQGLLRRQQNCRCTKLDQCGKAMFLKSCEQHAAKNVPQKKRRKSKDRV
jgi:MerR family transcriptional regulator, redox-sensitive transcriptional activator SoxR